MLKTFLIILSTLLLSMVANVAIIHFTVPKTKIVSVDVQALFSAHVNEKGRSKIDNLEKAVLEDRFESDLKNALSKIRKNEDVQFIISNVAVFGVADYTNKVKFEMERRDETTP